MADRMNKGLPMEARASLWTRKGSGHLHKDRRMEDDGNESKVCRLGQDRNS